MASRLEAISQQPHVPSTPAAIWAVGSAPLIPQLIGSVFNIWYNLTHIEPLLTVAQHQAFMQAIVVFNLLVYPVAVAVWVSILRSLWHPFDCLRRGQPVERSRLLQAQRRVINLPWLGIILAGGSWLLCIPSFLGALWLAPGSLDARIFLHLPTSIIISALIALAQTFFAIELLSQRLLYPVLFRHSHPAETPGAFPLSLRGRGLLWAISAGICPISSLLLLSLVPPVRELTFPWFTMAVGGLGIVFGMTTAWLLSYLVAEPVEVLQKAARLVSLGHLDVRVNLLRADEFGPLIDEFNDMVAEMQEKQRLQETFGRHVGQQAARYILQLDPGLGGTEQTLTVLFADIRNFTARCANCPPQQVVGLLNVFLTEMVDVVELHHGGMVNKFLGDGFMALFGIGEDSGDHAARAIAAGQEMLLCLNKINQRLAQQEIAPLAIGIGIHTGPAIVGCIGSAQRLEYTAIGDTVNIASRVEGLTKVLQQPLLFTQATRHALPQTFEVQALPPQMVRGQPQPIAIYGLNLSG